GRQPPLLAEWARLASQPGDHRRHAGQLLGKLKKASAEQRTAQIREFVQERFAKTLGIDVAGLEIELPLQQMGLDSLMAVEVKNEIETGLGIDIPLEGFTEDLTVDGLTRQVDLLVTETVGTATESDEQQPAETVDDQAPEQSTEAESTPPPDLDDLPAEYWQFEHYPEYRKLAQGLAQFDISGIGNPFFGVHEGITNDTAMIGGRRLISFSTYNYVGMSGHPEVAKAARDAVDRFGTSASASRVVSGEKTVHRELEQAICDFLDAEAAIAYIGGHATNETTIGHLFGPGDLM
ncbi:MAG: aminotransferase class I/II-fold pyridoxal phosphate-dependent enzyme, partial [Actinomycetia bacterium]|nr:aminotransferase class I/II-fold pyridoxal phosphate-dependent enzyme [Actinomycetes bacterium]